MDLIIQPIGNGLIQHCLQQAIWLRIILKRLAVAPILNTMLGPKNWFPELDHFYNQPDANLARRVPSMAPVSIVQIALFVLVIRTGPVNSAIVKFVQRFKVHLVGFLPNLLEGVVIF